MTEKRPPSPLMVLISPTSANHMLLAPLGRLMQLEYAMERVNKALPTVGILTSEGVVIGAERSKEDSAVKLLDTSKRRAF